MLITFTSKEHADVVMFGDIGALLLKAMGEKEEPPGILRGEDIKVAVEKLRAHLQMVTPEYIAPLDDDANRDDAELKEQRNYVGLRKRALPLLELLDAAYKKDIDVIWR